MSTISHERPFHHLCPEADKRDAMDDGEFWEYVFHRDEMPDDDEIDDYEEYEFYVEPECEVCGAWSGACGYDTEGRPWIHTTPKEDGDA